MIRFKFKTRTGVSCRTAKAVTITVLLLHCQDCASAGQQVHKLGTGRIQGSDRHYHSYLRPDGQSPHPTWQGGGWGPSPSFSTFNGQQFNADGECWRDKSGMHQPFVNALLAKVVLSPTPSVTGGCPPAIPTPAVITSSSSRPDHATPTQPSGGQQSTCETTSQHPDLNTASKAKYTHISPPSL